MIFYDRTGSAVAFCDDGEHIFLMRGTPAAYIYENCIYSYGGKQLGWYENGWVYDLGGSAVCFTENASATGPVKPVCRVAPVKGVKGVTPVKCVREVRRIRPVRRLSWSALSGAQFFV